MSSQAAALPADLFNEPTDRVFESMTRLARTSGPLARNQNRRNHIRSRLVLNARRRGLGHRRACGERLRASRVTAAPGTVPGVSSRPVIGLNLAIDGEPVECQTTCTWAGAHVLTVHTAIPRPDLALELHSTFVGHAGVPTHVVHLRLGPPGRSPSITAADHDEDHLDPTYAPRTCAYEHAQRLLEVLADLGYGATVDVPGDAAFEGLERVAQQPGY
jgi:hypothetical protein